MPGMPNRGLLGSRAQGSGTSSPAGQPQINTWAVQQAVRLIVDPKQGFDLPFESSVSGTCFVENRGCSGTLCRGSLRSG